MPSPNRAISSGVANGSVNGSSAAFESEARPHRNPHSRLAHIPGEPGTWIFIFGDMCLFAVLFCAFLRVRAVDRAAFALSQAKLDVDLGAINTVLLLVSSLFVVLAMRAVRSAARARAPLFILAAWLCGVAFLAIKAFEYSEKIGENITPQTNDFFMYYFVLTGLHAIHLLLGLGVLPAISKLARKPVMTDGECKLFEGGVCFWHMVDLLWIILFALIFLVR
jgi:nitric oxide reductase NorE protein